MILKSFRQAFGLVVRPAAQPEHLHRTPTQQSLNPGPSQGSSFLPVQTLWGSRQEEWVLVWSVTWETRVLSSSVSPSAAGKQSACRAGPGCACAPSLPLKKWYVSFYFLIAMSIKVGGKFFILMWSLWKTTQVAITINDEKMAIFFQDQQQSNMPALLYW